MYQFTYWLEHFKELSPSKAQAILRALLQLSARTQGTCSQVGKLENSNSLSSFRRIKQVIMKNHSNDLSQGERRSLVLFGDFLEFREYSNYKFPEAPTSKLLNYCETMQMSYSYKAVLILSLLSSINDTRSITLDILTAKMIAYYDNRLANQLPSEKNNSIFATRTPNFEAARKIIETNPIKVLVDAGVIYYSKRTSIVSFSDEYLPGDADYQQQVIRMCEKRLEKYYNSDALKITLPDPKKTASELAEEMIFAISNLANKVQQENLANIFSELCEVVGINTNSQTETQILQTNNQPISFDDERKIGALVKDCMQFLETKEYKFSEEQINKFLSLDWSKATLKLYYPFFKVFDDTKTIEEQKVDHLGNGRYWKRIYTFNEKKYLITSEWYKESKPLFISWYNTL